MSILEVIHIKITHRLYMLISLVVDWINDRDDREHIDIVMIIIDHHLVMHFNLSNTLDKINFIDKRRWFEMCLESSFVSFEEIRHVVLIVALFIIWVESAILSCKQQNNMILFEKIVIVLFDLELIARFLVIALLNIHLFTNLIEFDVRIDQLVSIDVDDIIKVLILS